MFTTTAGIGAHALVTEADDDPAANSYPSCMLLGGPVLQLCVFSFGFVVVGGVLLAGQGPPVGASSAAASSTAAPETCAHRRSTFSLETITRTLASRSYTSSKQRLGFERIEEVQEMSMNLIRPKPDLSNRDCRDQIMSAENGIRT